MVRHPVLQPQPHPHKDIYPPTLQAHLHLQLDQAGNTDRSGPGYCDWDLACGVGLHRVHAAASVLGLVSVLDDAGLLPARELVVGQRRSPYRE